MKLSGASIGRIKRTDERQPHKGQRHKRQDGHDDPEHGLQVQGEPEEAAVGGVDHLCAGLAALKHPLRVSRLGVDLVPPPETDEAAARNVLDVVEVGGEEEDGDDEDHDPERCQCLCRFVGTWCRRTCYLSTRDHLESRPGCSLRLSMVSDCAFESCRQRNTHLSGKRETSGA